MVNGGDGRKALSHTRLLTYKMTTHTLRVVVHNTKTLTNQLSRLGLTVRCATGMHQSNAIKAVIGRLGLDETSTEFPPPVNKTTA